MASVAQIEREIRTVVAARQALHDRGAGRDELEQNRRRLARLEARLTRQLIESHLSADPAIEHRAA